MVKERGVSKRQAVQQQQDGGGGWAYWLQWYSLHSLSFLVGMIASSCLDYCFVLQLCEWRRSSESKTTWTSWLAWKGSRGCDQGLLEGFRWQARRRNSKITPKTCQKLHSGSVTPSWTALISSLLPKALLNLIYLLYTGLKTDFCGLFICFTKSQAAGFAFS